MQTALIDPAGLPNPLLEICRILLEHEIERNSKTAAMSQTVQERDIAAATHRAAKANRPAYGTRKRRAGQTQEAQHGQQ